MNPYPFVGLNHFTVPVAISASSVARARYRPRPGGTRIAINQPSVIARHRSNHKAAVTRSRRTTGQAQVATRQPIGQLRRADRQLVIIRRAKPLRPEIQSERPILDRRWGVTHDREREGTYE